MTLFYFVRSDLVHRQTACAAIKHMALGVFGFGCEDALVHLLNYVWPNIFETSPHLVQAFMDAVEGMRVSLGPVKILQYTLQVHHHFLLSPFLMNGKTKSCFYFRDCSTLPAKFETFTGRFTIHSTSAPKIHSSVGIQKWQTPKETCLSATSSTMSCNFFVQHFFTHRADSQL